MKILSILLISLIGVGTALGQTNTFPSTGNVGIGTTSPDYMLDVNGPANNFKGMFRGPDGYILIGPANNGWAHIYSDRPAFIFDKPVYSLVGRFSAYDATDLSLETQGIARMTISRATGNVGIGTTSPSAALQVVGPPTASGATLYAAGGGDVLLNGGGSLFFDGNYSYGTGNYIRPVSANTQAFFTSGVERLRITSSGGIGVGTAAPYSASKLHVKSPSASPWGILCEASGNDRIVGLGHDGTTAFVSSSFLTSSSFSPLSFRTSNVNRIYIAVDGKVGVGTTSPTELLTVNGKVYAKEIKVNLNVPGPDYVFEPTYDLMSLLEVARYIEKNKHLPEVPSAKEMEANGINVSEMNMILLKKIEELTLHLIDQQKRIELLEEQLANSKK